MKDPRMKRYVYFSLSGFAAISMSILLFFALLRLEGLGSFFSRISSILRPFLYGGVVAYLLRPCCNLVENTLNKHLPASMKKSAATLSVLLSILFGLLLIYMLIIMIAPQLYTSVITIWNALPAELNNLRTLASTHFSEDNQLVQLFNSRTQEIYLEITKWVQEKVIPQASSIVSGVGMSLYRVLMFIYNLLIGFIVAVYLLSGRKKFARQGKLLLRGLLPDRWAENVLAEIRLVDSLFNGFINGKIVDSAIVGVICYIGCTIFRFPNPLLIAAIIGVTNVIPFFGPFIGAVPSTLLILIADPIKALWFILFVLILQQIDGNIIGPKILGNRTGLSSFWVMFAIILFGGLWGIAGMVIAVPLFAVMYDLVKRFVVRGLKQKNHSEMWDQYKADYPEQDDTRPA